MTDASAEPRTARWWLAHVAILTLAMGLAVTASWLVFANRIESYSFHPPAVVAPSRLLVYGSQFLLVGAFLYRYTRSRLRDASVRTLIVLVTGAWLGEGLVLTAIGGSVVANELSPVNSWFFWLVATAGPMQPAAAFVGGWLGRRGAEGPAVHGGRFTR